MRHPRSWLLLLASTSWPVAGIGCGDDSSQGAGGDAAASSSSQGNSSTGQGASTSSQGGGTSSSQGGGGSSQGGGGGGGALTRVTLFHTSDEHGWIAPDDVNVPGTVFGGGAQLLAQLTVVEGYEPEVDLLVSSGDNWTGPAISSWFQGEPAVEVFNAMGYRASALGNHEVDFGLDVLADRAAQAAYPYLAANVLEVETGERPAYLEAFRIVQAGPVSVGLIGLAGTHTATSADPRITVALAFEDPAETLKAVVPEVRAAGAEIVVILFHDCATAQLFGLDVPPVDLVLAGHCHGVQSHEVDGVPVVQSGEFFHGYTRIDLDLDRDAGAVVATEVTYTEVSRPAGEDPEPAPDPDVDAIVEDWQAQIEEELGAEVGFAEFAIPQASWLMSNWITDSWRAVHPEADIALLNQGAMRQSIPAGVFTVEDVFGVLPFDNRLVEIELTGAEIVAELTRAIADCGSCARLSGARFIAGTDPLEVYVNELPIRLETSYTVLVTDYLYYGGNEFELATYDDTPLELGENFRDAVVLWTTALGTSAVDPLEGYLDPVPRDQ